MIVSLSNMAFHIEFNVASLYAHFFGHLFVESDIYSDV